MTLGLFLPTSRREDFSSYLRQNEPTALALQKALQDPVLVAFPETHKDLQDLCQAWIHEDREAATKVGERILSFLQTEPRSDLGKGSRGLFAALAMDFGFSLWPQDLQIRMVGEIKSLAVSFTQISEGNPHIVTNNWFMISHGGCLLSCLACHGLEGPEGRVDVSDLETWALGRFKAFLAHFGNEGLYHEGSGYIAYTLSILLPALLALKNKRGMDLTEDAPSLRRSIRSMMMGTVLLPDTANSNASNYVMLDWNDTCREATGLNPLIPGILLSEEQDRAALKSFFDSTCGINGARKWGCPYYGLPLALALYPFEIQNVDPNEVLPTSLLDTRHGLGIWRDHWGDGLETVFGWYARTTHAKPGHAHDDAGSIRLISNGASWICGGGQNRTESTWQSVLTHSDQKERPKKKPNAYPFFQQVGKNGGVIGLEMRHVLEAYSERYLSWRTDLGYPVCFAVLDLVDEHQSPPRAFEWNVSFPKERKVELDSDGRGFRLTDFDAGTLHGRFLLDAPDDLEVLTMPESRRTFAAGNTEIYPGDKVISGKFRDRKTITVLVAIVVCPTEGVSPDLKWENGTICLNTETVWSMPFNGAILKSVDLEKDYPNLQKYPSGKLKK